MDYQAGISTWPPVKIDELVGCAKIDGDTEWRLGHSDSISVKGENWRVESQHAASRQIGPRGASRNINARGQDCAGILVMGAAWSCLALSAKLEED